MNNVLELELNQLLDNAKSINSTTETQQMIVDLFNNSLLLNFVGVQALEAPESKVHQLLCKEFNESKLSLGVESYIVEQNTHVFESTKLTDIVDEFDSLLINAIKSVANISTYPKDPEQLIFQTGKTANLIGSNTRRGMGNVILISQKIFDLLTDVQVNGGKMVDYLNSRFDVHISALLTNEIVIGYKGNMNKKDGDAGIIFVPHQLLINEDDVYSMQYGLLTENSANYYEIIVVDDE